jgi:hypothetical protein
MDDFDRFRQTFFPHARRETERVKQHGGRFAYYTTADTALKIIQSGEIWMRNTATMNDFSEVTHGLECLRLGWHSDQGAALKGAIDSAFPSLAGEIATLFDQSVPVIRQDTFLTCLSEHTDSEDKYGRLSMWRAYGGQAGVALILNGAVLESRTDVLGAYTTPVAYVEDNRLREMIGELAASIDGNLDYVRSLGREGLKGTMFEVLRFAAVSSKHPAFAEEKEWRVVAVPSMHPRSILEKAVVTIGHLPQEILRIKLEDRPEDGLVGLKPELLLERVLIGPCEHGLVVERALREALDVKGLRGKAIWRTDIPLRPNQR